MTDYTGRDEMDVLREQLNDQLEYIAKLEAECKRLDKGLQEMNLVVERNRQVANEEQLRRELSYRDGMIAGLKYAMRCNGVSGGEVNQ